MRLIKCRSKTLELEEFVGMVTPPFAILSHTSGDDDVTYSHFAKGDDVRKSMPGWTKIQRACSLALETGTEYLWIDSCCIDSSSTAELTEAMNGMFKWLGQASTCFVYLSDYDTATPTTESLGNAHWFTRGWSLQELIAPPEVHFYDKDWNFFGTKSYLCQELCSITGIDEAVLFPPRDTTIREILDEVPVGKIMSWASTRYTTRPEDAAYCLLGLFGVSIPIIWGEGAEAAFVRLQEEIIRNRNDLTIFAWCSNDGGPNSEKSNSVSPTGNYRGVFARSPAEFAGCRALILDVPQRFIPEFSLTNKGIRINTTLHRTTSSEHVFLSLRCHKPANPAATIGIYLKNQGVSTYVRVNPHSLFQIPKDDPYSEPSEVYLSKHLSASIARLLPSVHRHAFHFTFSSNATPTFQVMDTKPKELWDRCHNMFITSGFKSFVAFHRMSIGRVDNSFIISCGFRMDRPDRPWVNAGLMGSRVWIAAEAGNLNEVARQGSFYGVLRPTKLVLPGHSHITLSITCEIRELRGEPVTFVDVQLTPN
ncbi:hypothetical protein BX600DRAFT_467538 [Xylariales sp. PMI_506]|nr:hypothetical protein BX600DRAFT_467538 [Xylariales sp. PMI_506]